MSYDILLAKSPNNGCPGVTLAAHVRDVVTAVRAMFGIKDEPTRLGQRWLTFFGVAVEKWPRFYVNLLAAAALHDVGKANDGFQEEVRGNRNCQAIRHEHLSALLIAAPPMTRWLEQVSFVDVPLVVSAVMTHHLKARCSVGEHGFGTQLQNRKVSFPSDSSEFSRFWADLPKELEPHKCDFTALPAAWGFDSQPGRENLRQCRDHVKRSVLQALNEDCAGPDEPTTERQRLLMAVRAALIAADAAGSGLVREGKTIATWIHEQFLESPRWTQLAILNEIIDRRVNEINCRLIAQDRPAFDWNSFQLACDDLPSRALLLAPCGSGKTLAAWRWAAGQARHRPVNRVLFLYPTRATAKEGFRDYVSWAPEADAVLMHGTAAFDLQDMFDNEDDPRHENKYESEGRLFALGFWPKNAFSATVDQFLSFMQYNYRSVCLLPVLVDSVLVIDEVHSFDRNMLSALMRFLQCFDVPVLCMTATLTPLRLTQLTEECGLALYNDKPDDLAQIAEAPRYRLTLAESRATATERVAAALAAGRRVLWVVNTVNRCHELVNEFLSEAFDPQSQSPRLATPDGTPIYCYHSRFTLHDRTRRHEDIVASMRPGKPVCLGITTQVCEMSLDLDVDLLVTEYCPVTSLIQRMGRCNRDRDARPLDRSGEVIVYEPREQDPYSPDDLTGLDQFLTLVRDRDVTQVDLETALDSVTSPPWLGESYCPFLESGPYASANDASFRDSEDFNCQCVRREDVGAYLEAREHERPGFVLPVPKKMARARCHDAGSEDRRLPRHLGVAAEGHYHALLGYCDRPLDQWRTQ